MELIGGLGGPFWGMLASLAIAVGPACSSGSLDTIGAVPAASVPGEDEQDRPAPGHAWVIFGADTVRAEVASIPAQREKGLMDREEVPAGTGMLFVFPDNEYRSFWMKNTYVSLDVAFLDQSFEIVGIKQMEALDETLTDSNEPAALALEVIQGWFAAHDIGVGSRAEIVFGPGLTVR